MGRAADPLRDDMPNRVGGPEIPPQDFGGSGAPAAMVEASTGAYLCHALMRNGMQPFVHCPGEVRGRDSIGQTGVSLHGAGRGKDEDAPNSMTAPNSK